MFNLGQSVIKDKVDYEVTYDFLALGLGPASLNAGLYAVRKGLKTLVVGNELGGQLKNTSEVDNYLGFSMASAQSLIDAFVNHIKALEVPLLTNVLITKITKENDLFVVSLNNGKTLRSKTLLYALGGNPRKLNVPGEDKFSGRGLSYCVTCDGPFFKDKDVVVAGGGNSALDAGLDLARTSKSVTIVHRSTLRADQKSIDNFLALPNTTIILETQIKEITSDNSRLVVNVFDKTTSKERIIMTDGIFVEIGTVPNSSLLQGFVNLNESGEVIVDELQHTNVEGLFAAGDVTNNHHRQVIIAASDGAKAALEAANYINKKRGA